MARIRNNTRLMVETTNRPSFVQYIFPRKESYCNIDAFAKAGPTKSCEQLDYSLCDSMIVALLATCLKIIQQILWYDHVHDTVRHIAVFLDKKILEE